MRRRRKISKKRKYKLYDDMVYELKRTMTCPTCDNIMRKGDKVINAYFMLEENDFVIRVKKYCGIECVPQILQSK